MRYIFDYFKGLTIGIFAIAVMPFLFVLELVDYLSQRF